MPRNPSYLRLTDLSPVDPDAQILWGVPVNATEINRFILRKERGEGRVPYVVVSERRAVRVVEEGTLDARNARLAYLILRDQGRCFYCWRELQPAECTVEHLVARAHGGPDHASNLLLSCAPCNAMAGALPGVEKARLAVERRLGTVVASILDRSGVAVQAVGR